MSLDNKQPKKTGAKKKKKQGKLPLYVFANVMTPHGRLVGQYKLLLVEKR